jgi:hypothetical protein
MRKVFHNDAKWQLFLVRIDSSAGASVPRGDHSRWQREKGKRQKQDPFSFWMLLRRHEVRALFRRQVDG